MLNGIDCTVEVASASSPPLAALPLPGWVTRADDDDDDDDVHLYSAVTSCMLGADGKWRKNDIDFFFIKTINI